MPMLIQEGREGGGETMLTSTSQYRHTKFKKKKIKKKITHATESIRYLHQTHKVKYP